MFIKYQRYEWQVFKLTDEQWEEARNYNREETSKGFVPEAHDDQDKALDEMCAEQWFFDIGYKLKEWDGEALDQEVYFGETEGDL